jgi:hypothetical protein
MRNGWLDECCADMVRVQAENGYWTPERCISRAREFNTISDWQRECGGSFDSARHNGSYDECVAHMRKRRKRGSITPEICREDALRFASRTEWKKASPAIFAFARSSGLLDECAAHMDGGRLPNGHWTFERCVEAAAAFDTRNAWRWGDFKSYDAARRSGWIDDIAADAGMLRVDRSQAQRAFAEMCYGITAGSGIELREEVAGMAGPRTKVDMAFYRDGVPFLVVEYQGAYWHSEAAGKGRDYHRKRLEALRDKNVRLITAHEGNADNPVIMGMIRSALGLLNHKLRASKCTVVTVSNATARGFYDATHIQGGRITGKGQMNIGLEFDGRLVACMTLVRSTDRHTGSGSYDWCLHRFATISQCRVLGAAGRLFKHFRRLHPDASVVSYCDLQFFDGGTYRAIGFDHVRDNPPDYGWVKGTTVLAKHEAQRKHLPYLLGDSFDASMSERQNMERAGWSKIWDCGKAVYAYVP